MYIFAEKKLNNRKITDKFVVNLHSEFEEKNKRICCSAVIAQCRNGSTFFL